MENKGRYERFRGVYRQAEKTERKQMERDENAWDFYRKALRKSCIIYEKDGIIETVAPPRYGSVTLFFQDGKITHGETVQKFK